MSARTPASDRPAYVIGSGPSLRGFDFDALPDGCRIGANKSGWLAGCDILVTVDRNFHRNFRQEIETFPGEVFAVFTGAREEYPGVTYWEFSREEFSERHGVLCGLNSGFAALNLAFLLGYREIALLGFDFKWDGDRSHFHDGYSRQTRHVDRQLQNWAVSFRHAAKVLEAHDVRVTNFVGVSGSRLRVFPTAPLEELT